MMGQAMELREDWEEVKLKVMLEDALFTTQTPGFAIIYAITTTITYIAIAISCDPSISAHKSLLAPINGNWEG